MARFDVFAKLAQFMKGDSDAPKFNLSKKRLKSMRPKRYKPAFTMGFRGFPKTYKPCGSVPAPTIDQVRHIERKYGQRLHVKSGVGPDGLGGLMFFKTDGVMYTPEEAARRQANGII
jgi:hypothetical protein